MKLFFFLVHPTHYFAFFLRHLQNSLSKSVTMEVDYLDEVNAKYPWTSNFREGYTSSVSNGSFFKKELINKILKESDAVFVLAGWERTDKLFLILLLSMLRRKFLVYTDTPDTYKERNRVKDFARNLVLRFISVNAYGILVTGNIGIAKVNEWPFKFRRVINLPFFVDLDYFKPLSENLENSDHKHLIFFSSGRLLNSHKGFDLAIKAFAELKKSKALADFSYLIAGEGPDRTLIEKLIKDSDLVNEVKLLGWTEPGVLLDHYQSAHVFIHPSHFDPYPNAVLEAMACGLTVIASDKAGSAIDRIKHGVNGYLFKSGDISQLKENIVQVSDNRHWIRDVSELARKSAQEWPVSYGINAIEEILEMH